MVIEKRSLTPRPHPFWIQDGLTSCDVIQSPNSIVTMQPRLSWQVGCGANTPLNPGNRGSQTSSVVVICAVNS